MSCFQELGFHWLRYVSDAISPNKLGLTFTAVHYCEIISLHLGPCDTWYFMYPLKIQLLIKYLQLKLGIFLLIKDVLSGAYWDSYVRNKVSEGDI